MAKQFTAVAEAEISTRKLRNGNRIRIVLEMPYSEKSYLEVAELNFHDVEVTMIEYEGEELPFEEGD